MKKELILIILLHFTVVAFAQDEKDLNILEADTTWLKEIIKFPLNFAPEIDYVGYEDLRFAKNWSKPEGTEFWTYAFAWNIDLKSSPDIDMLETNLKLYYDGLMTAVNKDKDFTIPNTIVNINKAENETLNFYGNMQVYDSFFTKKVVNLYIDIETSYCTVENKYMMLFRISSLNFENDIWKSLRDIKLIKNYCKK